MKKKAEQEDNMPQSMKEFEMAWEEYFDGKPEPKNDEEERKEQEEFHYWYNNVRKQSDTGKTPAEMYKEIYGKEPPLNAPIDTKEPSRMMNFEWDEEEDEDFDEEKIDFNKELDNSEEEAVVVAKKIFENNWGKIKREIKGATKKEICQYSFILGFLKYMEIMDKSAEKIGEEIEDMSEEDIKKMISNFKEYEEKRKDV